MSGQNVGNILVTFTTASWSTFILPTTEERADRERADMRQQRVESGERREEREERREQTGREQTRREQTGREQK